MQTIAQYLRQEGIRQGIQRANREVAQKLLQQGVDYKIIEAVTGVSKEALKNLQSE